MSMDFRRRLPIPKDIKTMMPLSDELAERKAIYDKQIADIICGKDQRKLMVIGPCSADREDAVVDYACRLGKLAEEVADKLVLVPRVYTNKPRTTGLGYKGMLHQPDPTGESDLLEGLKAIRHLHMRVAEESGLFTADEMLYPQEQRFVSDLLSYVAVGARSAENQEHRLVASGQEVPVGLKNPTGGNLETTLNSVKAAQSRHMFIYRNWEVLTSGNPLAHVILRGYTGLDNKNHANYHYEALERVLALYQEMQLQNPAVVVDCNHANSGKRADHQPRIAREVMESCGLDSGIAGMVKGFMVESYLEDGTQPVDGGVYGKSITDPCIGWEKTVAFVRDLAERV